MLGGYVVVAVTVVLVVVVCCVDVVWPKKMYIYIYTLSNLSTDCCQSLCHSFVGSKDGFGVRLCDGLVG